MGCSGCAPTHYKQRVAVQLATSAVNLEWGKTQEDVAAENAAKSFEQAAKAAEAALSSAQGLQMREPKVPAARAAVKAASKPEEISKDALQFF